MATSRAGLSAAPVPQLQIACAGTVIGNLESMNLAREQALPALAGANLLLQLEEMHAWMTPSVVPTFAPCPRLETPGQQTVDSTCRA